MRNTRCAALFAACLAVAPAASAGEFFINGQAGRIDLDSGLGDGRSNLQQGSVGYRWGIRYAEVGLEAGVGKLDDADGRSQLVTTGGTIDRTYTLSSRYAQFGVNARIKTPLLPVFLIGRAGVLGMERALDETVLDRAVDTAPVTSQQAFKETDGGTYAGVGVGTTILPLLDVGLMYTQYRYSQVRYDPVGGQYRLSDDTSGARSVNLTVEYRF